MIVTRMNTSVQSDDDIRQSNQRGICHEIDQALMSAGFFVQYKIVINN